MKLELVFDDGYTLPVAYTVDEHGNLTTEEINYNGVLVHMLLGGEKIPMPELDFVTNAMTISIDFTSVQVAIEERGQLARWRALIRAFWKPLTLRAIDDVLRSGEVVASTELELLEKVAYQATRLSEVNHMPSKNAELLLIALSRGHADPYAAEVAWLMADKVPQFAPAGAENW